MVRQGLSVVISSLNRRLRRCFLPDSSPIRLWPSTLTKRRKKDSRYKLLSAYSVFIYAAKCPVVFALVR